MESLKLSKFNSFNQNELFDTSKVMGGTGYSTYSYATYPGNGDGNSGDLGVPTVPRTDSGRDVAGSGGSGLGSGVNG